MERFTNTKNLILNPEQIDKIDWVVFSREQGAPFNLRVCLDPYIFTQKSKEQLIADFLNPSKMVPYYRWQFCRRVVNPLWIKGSGFEGHLVGLDEQEILKILQEQEDYLIRRSKSKGYSLKIEQFIHNPNHSIGLELAFELRVDFEVILAKMRAIRSQLQIHYPENREFQNYVYSSVAIYPENTIFFEGNSLIVGFSGFNSKKNKEHDPIFNEDIRHRFPILAEIGRFGFPPLGILIHHLSANHQI